MTALILAIALLSLQFLSEGLVYLYSIPTMQDREIDYILLLGIKGARGRGFMLDKVAMAAEAAKLWPRAKLLITGNEAHREVTELKQAVIGHGVDPDRILEETQSRDTWDNIGLSQRMIPKEARVAIVTNGFHQRRSLAIANVLGMHACLFGRDPRPHYALSPYYYLRERGANLVWLFLFLRRLAQP